jgi:hypothetical protein
LYGFSLDDFMAYYLYGFRIEKETRVQRQLLGVR